MTAEGPWEIVQFPRLTPQKSQVFCPGWGIRAIPPFARFARSPAPGFWSEKALPGASFPACVPCPGKEPRLESRPLDFAPDPSLRYFHGCSGEEARARAIGLLREVGLREDHLLALPHQLSGGQRQRVCLARALAADPQLLICDEVTSSLDVVVQGATIDLIKRLQKERNLTVLFITHDFGLALQMADRTMVLYKGELVEEGPTRKLIANPQHEYTQNLVLSAQLGE